MNQFLPLTVTNIVKTIRDAVVITLEPDDSQAFDFIPGQYLTFKRLFEGQELRRSYSICAGKNDGVLQVGIKRVDGGTFSTWANTELSIGEKLEAMPPMGNFYAAHNSATASTIAFAGGSGITPILSIIKSGLEQDATTRFSLVYANRSTSTIMFREELEDLKNKYLNRFSVIHILGDQSGEIDLFNGRIDAEKCSELFHHWIPIKTIDMAYICGPEPMMIAIREALKNAGLTKEQIRLELFGSAQPGLSKQPAAVINYSKQGVEAQVTINGETRRFVISPGDTLLEASHKNNVDAPFACKAGVCSTCKAKLIEGKVEMRANHALEDNDVENGYVLTCQSMPVTDTVVWDYDQAGH